MHKKLYIEYSKIIIKEETTMMVMMRTGSSRQNHGERTHDYCKFLDVVHGLSPYFESWRVKVAAVNVQGTFAPQI